MKSTVRPLGIGLVIFPVLVICVGCASYLARNASALARPALSPALSALPPPDPLLLPPLLLLLLPLLPHAAISSTATAMASATTSRLTGRRGLLASRMAGIGIDPPLRRQKRTLAPVEAYHN